MISLVLGHRVWALGKCPAISQRTPAPVLSNPAASCFCQGGEWLTSLVCRVSALSMASTWVLRRMHRFHCRCTCGCRESAVGEGFPLSFCTSSHLPAPAPTPSNLSCTLHDTLPQIFPPTPRQLEVGCHHFKPAKRLTCLLRNLYAGQEATVRTRHGTTDWFQL